MEHKQIDPKMQRAHEALLNDGWGLLTKDYYEKPCPGDMVLTLTPKDGFWRLKCSYVPNSRLVGADQEITLARFEHLIAAAEAMTWEGKER